MKPEIIEIVTDVTNRSVTQTKFLLNLVEDDLDKLLDLEVRIKNLHLSYCPATKEECESIFNMLLPDECWFPKPIIIIYESKPKIKWLRRMWNSILRYITNLLSIRRRPSLYRLYTT